MRISLILFLFTFWLNASLGFCDIVVLKNGNSMEGVIEKEDTRGITLHLGYGRISFEKKDVESIQRYNPVDQGELVKSWNYRYFSRPGFIPEGLKGLALDFDNLKALRGQAVKSKKQTGKAKREFESLERDLSDFNKDLASVSEQLQAANPKDDLEKYNSLVNEFNSLMAKVKVADYKKNELQKKMLTLNKNISDFINEFTLFRNRLSREKAAPAQVYTNKKAYFFEGVRKELDVMGDDFIKHKVTFERSGLSIVVEASLNGVLKIPLMVDTGASVVVISKDIARKLGIDSPRKSSPLFLTVADGRKVPATPVILESIRVGDVEVKNVKAAVLEIDGAREEYGLLGMSFLENFVIKIDAKSKRLIFEEFNP
jgi:clan AA aspartic protease (TIGR02281 family)